MDLLQRFKKERGNQKAEIPELPQLKEVIEPEYTEDANLPETKTVEITSTDIPETPPPLVAALGSVAMKRIHETGRRV